MASGVDMQGLLGGAEGPPQHELDLERDPRRGTREPIGSGGAEDHGRNLGLSRGEAKVHLAALGQVVRPNGQLASREPSSWAGSGMVYHLYMSYAATVTQRAGRARQADSPGPKPATCPAPPSASASSITLRDQHYETRGKARNVGQNRQSDRAVGVVAAWSVVSRPQGVSRTSILRAEEEAGSTVPGPVPIRGG